VKIKTKDFLKEIENFFPIKDGIIYFHNNLIYARTAYMNIYVYSEYNFDLCFGVKYMILFNFLSQIKSEEFEFDILEKIIISSKINKKKMKLELVKLDVDDFVKDEFIEENNFLTLEWLNFENLIQDFKLVGLSKNKTYFEGILCIGSALYSTDKIRLSEVKFNTPIKYKFWISQNVVDIILKYKGLEKVFMQANFLMFSSANVYIKCLLRNYDNFPIVAIEKIINDNFEIQTEFPLEFIEDILNFNIFSDKELIVCVECINQHLVIRGNNNLGEILLESSIEFNVIDFKFNIEYCFLLEILKLTNKFKLSNKAILFYNDNFKYLVNLYN
jgi:hypothetical protein